MDVATMGAGSADDGGDEDPELGRKPAVAGRAALRCERRACSWVPRCHAAKVRQPSATVPLPCICSMVTSMRCVHRAALYCICSCQDILLPWPAETPHAHRFNTSFSLTGTG